jgi:hypothetical protein
MNQLVLGQCAVEIFDIAAGSDCVNLGDAPVG